jgi:hypothetical protein
MKPSFDIDIDIDNLVDTLSFFFGKITHPTIMKKSITNRH